VGDIQHEGESAAAGGARGVVDLGAGARGHGHSEAVGGQAQRDGAADAAAAAGDERDTTHAVILSVSYAVPGSVELPLEHLSVLWVNRREAPRVKSARTRPLFAPVVLVLRIAFFLARGQDGRPPAWRAMLC